MLWRRVFLGVVVVMVLSIMMGCDNQKIPPASQFQIQAIGTLMPGGHDESVKPDFGPDTSGVLFVNQTGLNVQVAVSNTIATLPSGQDFLFILPPGTHQFYLYQPDLTPRVHTETTEAGKLRYVYLSKALPK